MHKVLAHVCGVTHQSCGKKPLAASSHECNWEDLSLLLSEVMGTINLCQ
jgi:hypothetical protein